MPKKRTYRKVAPFHSCIACLKGDTSTLVQVEGDWRYQIAALETLAGLEHNEAAATFQAYCEHDSGLSTWPEGRMTFGFRLCRDCAEKYEVDICDTGDEMLTVYVQPEES
jgi:hypothetical protein